MTKVAYNTCFGGFSLSDAAMRLYKELSGKEPIGNRDFCRHDPILIRVIEQLGPDANGQCARLAIHELDGKLYRIDEYDGSESVETPESYDWVAV